MLALGGTSKVQADSGAQHASIARKSYVQYCSSCHGVMGKGDGPVAKSLVQKPSDLTEISKRRGGKFPAAEIAEIIDGRFAITAHGERQMPIWGRSFAAQVGGGEIGEEHNRGQVQMLVEYLESIQRVPSGGTNE